MDSQKRQVACRCNIKEILEAKYVRQEGWNPNYMVTEQGEQISRVNILATIVTKTDNSNGGELLVDDASGQITVRVFEQSAKWGELGIGDIVTIIGRPREFGTEKYIMLEIIQRVKDQKWIEVHNKMVQLRQPVLAQIAEPPEHKLTTGVNKIQVVYDLIKKLDVGDGAETGDVIKKAKVDNAEEIIEQLLKGGEIFEIKRGRLKVLE
ncbi:MAG: hypothetical protein ABIG95_06130 [Candidatus Woesearchaeota archaeon]